MLAPTWQMLLGPATGPGSAVVAWIASASLVWGCEQSAALGMMASWWYLGSAGLSLLASCAPTRRDQPACRCPNQDSGHLRKDGAGEEQPNLGPAMPQGALPMVQDAATQPARARAHARARSGPRALAHVVHGPGCPRAAVRQQSL
jgi:hypothetical protein